MPEEQHPTFSQLSLPLGRGNDVTFFEMICILAFFLATWDRWTNLFAQIVNSRPQVFLQALGFFQNAWIYICALSGPTALDGDEERE